MAGLTPLRPKSYGINIRNGLWENLCCKTSRITLCNSRTRLAKWLTSNSCLKWMYCGGWGIPRYISYVQLHHVNVLKSCGHTAWWNNKNTYIEEWSTYICTFKRKTVRFTYTWINTLAMCIFSCVFKKPFKDELVIKHLNQAVRWSQR
jgi:hypothetical protein